MYPGLSARKRTATNGVSLDRVDEVELGRVLRWVKVVEPLPEDVEAEAVEVQQVSLGSEDASVRPESPAPHVCVERQHYNLGPVHHVGVVRRRVCRCS
jgi:hypothetical protein